MNSTTVGILFYLISLRDVLSKIDLLDSLDKPQYMWNADETSICFLHQPMKMVSRSATQISRGELGITVN